MASVGIAIGEARTDVKRRREEMREVVENCMLMAGMRRDRNV